MSDALLMVLAACVGLSVGFGIGYAFGWVARSNQAATLDRIDREIAELERQLEEAMPDDEKEE